MSADYEGEALGIFALGIIIFVVVTILLCWVAGNSNIDYVIISLACAASAGVDLLLIFYREGVKPYAYEFRKGDSLIYSRKRRIFWNWLAVSLMIPVTILLLRQTPNIWQILIIAAGLIIVNHIRPLAWKGILFVFQD